MARKDSGRIRGAWRPQAASQSGISSIPAVIAVPVSEELAFRGFLLRRLVASHWEFLHGDAVAGSIAGLLYAVLRSVRKNRDAVVGQASANGFPGSL
ncbi:MAG TPA: CPBP family glutamic-type intramembrane protease [Bryobacteraceae bacterium]